MKSYDSILYFIEKFLLNLGSVRPENFRAVSIFEMWKKKAG